MARVEIDFNVVTRDASDNESGKDPAGPPLPARVVSPVSCPDLWPLIENIGKKPTRDVTEHSKAAYQTLADSLAPAGMTLKWLSSYHDTSGGVWFPIGDPETATMSHLFRVHVKGNGDPVYKASLNAISSDTECHYTVAITETT